MAFLLFNDLSHRAASVSEEMTADLTWFQTWYPAVDKYVGGEDTDELLAGHFKGVRGAISAYVLFAGNILNPEPGKSKSRFFLNGIVQSCAHLFSSH